MKHLTFLIYILAWEAAVWGGWFYIVFVLDRSAWWTLLAIVCSGSTIPVRRWTGQREDAA